MAKPTSAEYLSIAREHLKRVQAAWGDPTDWADLGIYGLYCVEAAVMAAATHLRWPVSKIHTAKQDIARRLTTERHLPEISERMSQLNDTRKAIGYGDVERPDLDAEEVATQIEEFVEAVARLLKK